ncbi:MAG: sugar ABC transporter permease [Chloroflexia bacterium]|nr:sugar ABC transporter permease [Chloroflexia bacterium]
MGSRARRAPRQVGERNNAWAYLFIAPAIGLYLLFSIWPIFRGAAMAFTDYRFIYSETRWDFNGLSNYREMWGDDNFWAALRVTLRFTLYVLPFTVLISFVLAVVISRVTRLAGFYRWMIYLPVILPVAVTYLMFGELFNTRFGLINVTLQNLGMERPPNWLSDVDYALRALSIADIWRGVGFPTLLFLIGLYAIGTDLYEAAAVDGATGWQQLRSITLPLLKPVFALVLLLGLSSIPMTIDPMLILTGGAPRDTTMTLGLYSYQIAFQFGDLRLGYASAINLVLGLSSAVVALIVFRSLRGDIESTGPGRRWWRKRNATP